MKRLSVALAMAIAALGPRAGAAAAITFSTALPVTEGSGISRLQTRYLSASGDSTSLDRELTVLAVPVVTAYGVTERLAVFAVVPLLDKELELTTPDGRRRRRVSGPGDVTLLARYTAYQHDEPGATWRVAPIFGVEAPTGDDDAVDALGPLPAPLQLGSGSWDFLAGTVLTRQTLAWQIDLALTYRLNSEGNAYEIGDVARLDFSYQKRLLPRTLGAGVPSFLYGVIESNLVGQDRDELAGAPNPGSGGWTWYVAPGLQYVRKRLVLEGAVQIPVVQELHGDALEADFNAILSMRVNW